MNRVESAERAAKAQSNFSEDCICFSEEEQPFFCDLSEEEIAAEVKCPLHGDRFKQPIFHVGCRQGGVLAVASRLKHWD